MKVVRNKHFEPIIPPSFLIVTYLFPLPDKSKINKMLSMPNNFDHNSTQSIISKSIDNRLYPIFFFIRILHVVGISYMAYEYQNLITYI